jgi:hypothetical protein
MNDITSIPNFIKIYQAVQKLLMGTHRHTQTDRLVIEKPTSIFGKYAKKEAYLFNVRYIHRLLPTDNIHKGNYRDMQPNLHTVRYFHCC